MARQQLDHAGSRDWNVRLETCKLCSDGKFHVVDRFSRRLRATATPIFVRATTSASLGLSLWCADALQSSGTCAIAEKSSSRFPALGRDLHLMLAYWSVRALVQGWPHGRNLPSRAASSTDGSAEAAAPTQQQSRRSQIGLPKWLAQLASPQDSLDIREVLSRNREAGSAQQAPTDDPPVDDSAAAHQQQQQPTPAPAPATPSAEDLTWANILPAPKPKGYAAKVS